MKNLIVIIDLDQFRRHSRIRPLEKKDQQLIEVNMIHNIKNLVRAQGVPEENIKYENTEDQYAENDVLYFSGSSFIQLNISYIQHILAEEKNKSTQMNIYFWEENTTREILGFKELQLIKLILGLDAHQSSDFFIESGIKYIKKGAYLDREEKICHFPLGGLQYHFDKLGFEVTLSELLSLQESLSEKAPIFRPCLFLDRDGILIEDKHYLKDPKDIVIKEKLIPLLLHFQKNLSYLLCVVSNQAGIARGKLTRDDHRRVTNILNEELLKRGVEINSWHYCPYLYEESLITSPFGRESFLRKPFPGMVWKAQEEFLIDLSTSLMIGDKDSDVLSLLNLPTYILQDQYPVSLDEVKQKKANIFNDLDSLVNHLLA